MEAFLGKWENVREGNKGDVEGFLKAAGYPQDKIDYYMKLDADNIQTVTFSQKGDGYSHGSVFGPISTEVDFKLGEPLEKALPPDGKLTKMTYALEDGALVDYSEQEDLKTVHRRTVEGDVMTMVVTLKEVSITRQFKRV